MFILFNIMNNELPYFMNTFGIGNKIARIENFIITFINKIYNTIIINITSLIKFFYSLYYKYYASNLNEKMQILAKLIVILTALIYLLKILLVLKRSQNVNKNNKFYSLFKFFGNNNNNNKNDNKNSILLKNNQIQVETKEPKDKKLKDFINKYNKMAMKMYGKEEEIKKPFYSIINVYMNKKF
jgi:hypothetical protein